MVISECRVRAEGRKRAEIDEAWRAVVFVFLQGMKKFPKYIPALYELASLASRYFPDLTATPKRQRKYERSGLLLKEEERTFRSLQKEEWRELHPPDLAAEA
jgi:hypothetical protein